MDNGHSSSIQVSTVPKRRTAASYAVVGLEDLNVAGMLKNHHLALSLSDAALGEIRRQFEYKCAGFGGPVVRVNRFYPSSRLCGVCGAKHAGLKLSDREWSCPTCGALNQRDSNAARNIELEVIRILEQTPVVASSGVKARGGDVRPVGSLAIPVETRIYERSLLNT